MNHAWVGGGLPLPNSAVPVLPNVPDGSPAPAAVPPDCTTLAMNDRNVATTSPPSAGRSPVGLRRGLGRERRLRATGPDATAAATDAICNGLASTRPCPIADAASSARSFGFGNVPPYDGTGSDHLVAEAEERGGPRERIRRQLVGQADERVVARDLERAGEVERARRLALRSSGTPGRRR